MESVTLWISLIAAGLALYALVTSRRATHRDHTKSHGQDTQRKLEQETERKLIYDLVREVQALRETKIRELKESGKPVRRSIYARVYEETALLTHNTAGPSNGWYKLFVEFRGRNSGTESPFPGRPSWAELNVLPRLGFDERDLSEYNKKAQEAMHYT